MPGEPKLVDIVDIDLVERAVALLGLGAAVLDPVGRFAIGGGQPIGILERSFANLAKLFTRWLPGPRRRAREMRAREAETKA